MNSAYCEWQWLCGCQLMWMRLVLLLVADFLVISAYLLPFHLMSVLLTVTVHQCTSVNKPIFLFTHCCWTDWCCTLLDIYCMYCESWFASFFLSVESALPTFSIQSLISKFMLWLEYCSIEMPTAWQWSAIQMKRLYIEWSSEVLFIHLKVKTSLCTLCSCHVQCQQSLFLSAAVGECTQCEACVYHKGIQSQ